MKTIVVTLLLLIAVAISAKSKIDLQVREELITSPRISILVHMKEKASFDKHELQQMDHSVKGHFIVKKVISQNLYPYLLVETSCNNKSR
jgi:hypothetical protein